VGFKVERTIRALVVDDNPAVREAVTDMLRTFGMKAASAVSGRAALKLCAGRCPFDVILADVVMNLSQFTDAEIAAPLQLSAYRGCPKPSVNKLRLRQRLPPVPYVRFGSRIPDSTNAREKH
jgi:CheY-like chemotaxis protein